jgi:CRISPR-associated protein Csx16
MTVWFVSRHAGAVEWARKQGLAVDRWVTHLDVGAVAAGDTVAGTLPVHLAAAVCARGARYLHLAVDLPAELRGSELAAEQLQALGCRLQGYRVHTGAPGDDIGGPAARDPIGAGRHT